MTREKEWKAWCDNDYPEEERMPGGIDSKLNTFQKLLIIRCWCPDRTLSQAKNYVESSLGSYFLEDIIFNLENIAEEADCQTPIICLLSTGSDPCNQIDTIARNRMHGYRQISMGQGQEELARKLITESILKPSVRKLLESLATLSGTSTGSDSRGWWTWSRWRGLSSTGTVSPWASSRTSSSPPRRPSGKS